MLLEARLCPNAPAAWLVIDSLAPRFILAAFIVALLCWRNKPLLTGRELRQGLIVGAFAAVGIALQNDGLRYTSASTSAFLTQFYAISIPIWLAIRSRRLPPWSVAVACVLVLAGVAILGHFDWRHLRLGRGEVETLLCSLVFMGQILWLDSPRFAGNRALPVTLVMFALAGAIFTAVGFAAAPDPAPWRGAFSSPAWWSLTAVLAVFSTVATYWIMNAWQPRISSTEAGLLYCFEPIFGSLLALCLPAWFSRWTDIEYANERVTVSLLIGGGLITAANLLIQWKPPPRRAA